MKDSPKKGVRGEARMGDFRQIRIRSHASTRENYSRTIVMLGYGNYHEISIRSQGSMEDFALHQHQVCHNHEKCTLLL